MNTRVLENGMIAIGLDNINELLAAKQLGMFLCDGNGYYFDDDIEDEDGVEREPTDEEKTNRAIDELRDGCRVFATMYAPDGYKLVEQKSTTLQSDFFVGQSVYLMSDNRICKGEIYKVVLSEEKGNRGVRTCEKSYRLMHPYTLRQYTEDEIFATKEELIKHLMEE